MAHTVPTKPATNACMAAAREQAERYRNMHGPSNAELLKEITELKQMVADLKILVLTKPH